MTMREDIIAKLTAEPIIKIHGKPAQSNIHNLENELVERSAIIKITKDIIKIGKKICFLIIVLELAEPL